MLPLGFAFANLIIYWGGFAATWKLALGLVVLGLLGDYGGGGAQKVLPDDGDTVFAAVFAAVFVAVLAVAIHYFAVRQVQPQDDIAVLVSEDLEEPQDLGPAPGFA
ncbi:MAG: hypothetical protein ACRYG2_25430 [Janthinobacterium lividum]